MEPSIKNLPANLKALREARGLTQRELEKLSDTSSVAMIESGRRCNPSFEIVEALAGALGVPMSRLLKDPSAGHASKPTPRRARRGAGRTKSDGASE